MRGEPGFFDVEERLRELSAKGGELERLNGVVDFELDASKNRWPFAVIADSVWLGDAGGSAMAGQPGFFDVEERLKQLSAKGDSLERLNAVVDFGLFRADLEHAVPRSDRAKGGRPPFDHVLMFKVLVLQSSPVGRAHGVPDPGPAVVHALPGPGTGRHGAGRQHDLDLPRGADAGPDRRQARDRGAVCAL
jgi:hypothetical protein